MERLNTIDAFFERCNALMGGQHPRTILRRAIEILSVPEQWTRFASASDEFGNHVRPEDPRAVAWCIEGAISVASNRFGIVPPYFMLILDRVAQDDYESPCVTLLEQSAALDHQRLMTFLGKVMDRLPVPCAHGDSAGHPVGQVQAL